MAIFLKKILPFLLHPLMLAIVPTVVIIMLVPMKRDRYLLEEVESNVFSFGQYVYFEDLTGDGKSEQILIGDNMAGTAVIISNSEGITINQWNVRGKLPFSSRSWHCITGDYNNSGTRELFFFTQVQDSIFLHGLFNLGSNILDIPGRFLAKLKHSELGHDASIIPAEMDDLNGDGKKELIFGITTGLSLNPRNIFAFFIEKDSLISSPEGYYPFDRIIQADINANGKREIIISGQAASNADRETVLYHDHQNWLMAFDQNLQFLFDPIAIEGRFEFFRIAVLKRGDSKAVFGLKTKMHGEEPSRIYSMQYPDNFQLLAEFDEPFINLLPYSNDQGDLCLALSGIDDVLMLYNVNKKKWLKNLPDGNYFHSFIADLDGCGHDEMIMVNGKKGIISIFRGGFRHRTNTRYDNQDLSWPRVQIIKEHANRHLLSLQDGRHHFIFNYRPNPVYYINFLAYLAIYFGVLSFTFIVQKAQRRQIAKQRETEKRIAELQINLIKNKLDPHFSINALNSVIQAIRDDRRDVAEDGLLQFVGIYRNMLLSADKVDRSLDEELAFTESYLKLEKLRYDGVFDYSIEVARGVDHATLVPKMVVQLHAENAVKHGLAPLGQGGRLHIGVNSSEEGLKITIADNGIGFSRGVEASGPRRSQGLKLMQEFYHLYPKISGRMIQSHIEELSDAQGEPAGTRVTIIIREKS